VFIAGLCGYLLTWAGCFGFSLYYVNLNARNPPRRPNPAPTRPASIELPELDDYFFCLFDIKYQL
jgi:hypothetical protein